MNEDELARQSARLLDEHAEAIDGETLSRLHQARNRALSRRRNPWRLRPSPWLGGGAIAASLLVAVIYVNRLPPPLPDIYQDPLQQAAAEELELMDDLEFMAWLLLEEDLGNDAGTNT